MRTVPVRIKGDSGDHAIVAAGWLRMDHGVAAKDEASLVARGHWKLNEAVTALVARRCEVNGTSNGWGSHPQQNRC